MSKQPANGNSNTIPPPEPLGYPGIPRDEVDILHNLCSLVADFLLFACHEGSAVTGRAMTGAGYVADYIGDRIEAYDLCAKKVDR